MSILHAMKKTQMVACDLHRGRVLASRGDEGEKEI